MNKISVVIITLNAEKCLEEVLVNAQKITDNIIVVDSFSTDNTKLITQKHHVSFYERTWDGYGNQKNFGNEKATHHWILSLDADEVPSLGLINELQNLNLNNKNIAYNIPFKNIYCGKLIKYGRWKNEQRVRLFNKKTVAWNTDYVHEKLKLENVKIATLKNAVYHHSMHSKAEHIAKAQKYAAMGAENLYRKGKKATFLKRFLNPVFRFIADYFFRFGFLDGKLGLQVATIISKETYWKYQKLAQLNHKH